MNTEKSRMIVPSTQAESFFFYVHAHNNDTFDFTYDFLGDSNFSRIKISLFVDFETFKNDP